MLEYTLQCNATLYHYNHTTAYHTIAYDITLYFKRIWSCFNILRLDMDSRDAGDAGELLYYTMLCYAILYVPYYTILYVSC